MSHKEPELYIKQGFSPNAPIFFFFFGAISFIIALLFSLPPRRNSDPGSHSRLFSPLPLHYGSCLSFLSREDINSTLSSLVDSRRTRPYLDYCRPHWCTALVWYCCWDAGKPTKNTSKRVSINVYINRQKLAA